MTGPDQSEMAVSPLPVSPTSVQLRRVGMGFGRCQRKAWPCALISSGLEGLCSGVKRRREHYDSRNFLSSVVGMVTRFSK